MVSSHFEGNTTAGRNGRSSIAICAQERLLDQAPQTMMYETLRGPTTWGCTAAEQSYARK